jgi:hypothetical protein
MAEQKCADCSKVSPKTESVQTLIGRQYGWRLINVTKPGGRAAIEWRCPECWERFKEAKQRP